MKILRLYLLQAIGILLLSNYHLSAQQEINIHYLGHASFVVEFGDGITVLTDFGTSYCWGYNSPIYDIGDFVPLIMTYSHYHDDHYEPSRIPDGVQYTLDLIDTLNIMDLSVHPVRTCETTPGVETNTSFIFEFKGLRICHLGDAQAEIMNIADPEQQQQILEKFPDRIDILFMTVEGVYPFIPEAELFIDLLQPGIVIPMHYWSPEYKEEFLSYLELQNDTAGKSYDVNRLEEAGINIMTNDTIHNNVVVYGLSPATYSPSLTPGSVVKQEELHCTVFPNPAKNRVNINFMVTDPGVLHIKLISINGSVLKSITTGNVSIGLNSFSIDVSTFPEGSYLMLIEINQYKESKKLIIQ